MDGANKSTDHPSEPTASAIDAGGTFLAALFDEADTVLFRPIETWLENGKKRSRVDYRNTLYRKAVPGSLRAALRQLLEMAEEGHLNLFFGVCPRFGKAGRYDLAWQIRTVRALWVDIDHVSVAEARERIAQAGLPAPSVLVNSGGGVHGYWLLAEPYLIDDVDDPQAVETEWETIADGRKKSRKYIMEDGEKVFLEQRRHVTCLSPKAQHAQNVLAGIAKAVGGDHTTDLSRLLRLPGTLNRKDERNGREPVPCTLIECDKSRRYPLSIFEPLAIVSDDVERERQISAMPLPQQKKVSPSKAEKLAELIAASSIAKPGSRSEADFEICCFAVRQGISKEEVWGRVERVGKFAEQGQRYFDLTWQAAEHDTRAAVYDKLQKRTNSQDRHAKSTGGAGGPGTAAECEFNEDGRRTIVVDARTTPVAETLHQVTDRLLASGNCFSRADQLVVINDEQIAPILASPELAGLLNQHVEFFFVSDRAGEFKPFPPAYANTWLNHFGQRSRLSAIKLFTRNPVYSDDWRLIPPGFDANSGIYYAGPAVPVRDGTDHLDTLLRDFCFHSPADRTNYLGMLLTTVLVPKFIGSKPAALFNGNQPELGKSILAQLIAILRDGQSAETASYNPNDEEFEKRLGAIVRRGATTIIIDNAKSRGRSPRIESACLERSITDQILSFRLLGQSASIRAENSHIFCITANSAEVSRDLVTRSVVINLYFEGDPEHREFSIADPEGYAHEHRIELLGELVGMVERWKAQGSLLAKTHSRFNKRGWGNIVGGILHACGEPDFLANAEVAAAQLDETRGDFAELVAVMADHPQGTWTPKELVELCDREGLLKDELGEGSTRSQSTRFGVLAGRYVAERFARPDGREMIFHKSADRKGTIFKVENL